jgi:2-polyprenyl-3-methyl-5-hydroxy-6-metoxy-1,4-benzoquinol methylase
MPLRLDSEPLDKKIQKNLTVLSVIMNCPVCAALATSGDLHPEAELYRCTECGHRFSRLKPGVLAEPYNAAYFEEMHRNWFAHPNLALFEKIARIIEREPIPHSVIDVGCGNGNLLRYLSDRLPSSSTLTGVDLMANLPQGGIEFIEGDALSVELGRQFSVVVTLGVIEHVLDPQIFAQRLKSLARPGGLIIIMTINDASVLYATARLLRCFGVTLPFDRLYGGHHLQHFNHLSLSRLLEGVSLEVEELISHNTPLASVDIPVPSDAAALVLRGGVGLLFSFGWLSRRTYLQTVVCRRAIEPATTSVIPLGPILAD